MLDVILGRASRRCDGAVSPRFLRVGALGGLGLTLPALLRSQARGDGRAARDAGEVRDPRLPRRRHVAPRHVRPQAGCAGRDPRPVQADRHVSARRPNQRKTASAWRSALDRISLVRSGSHNNDHHETATNWALCGRFGSAFGDYPAMGAVAAYELGFRGQLPPYVSVPRNPSFTWELGKSAYLGGRYESFKAGDPNEPNYKVQDVSPNEDVTAKRSERQGPARGRGRPGEAGARATTRSPPTTSSTSGRRR